VRQLGHEFEHVKQFEAGVYDFARQEFLAYGWMLEGADPEASDSVQMAGSRGAHSTLPPLSQEEQLTIAAQVNEFWRMLPLSAKSDPEYAAIHAATHIIKEISSRSTLIVVLSEPSAVTETRPGSSALPAAVRSENVVLGLS
jgi:hypothetical protein